MASKIVLICLFFQITTSKTSFFIPIQTVDRKDVSQIQLTTIGKFGLIRKERKTVASHLHTGIDIKRPNNNYINEPIFVIATGKVISKRTDGPYAQLIIEHQISGNTFWTVYEHIAGITVQLHETVNPDKPIARYMSKTELNKYGWQFDHFHLEILKLKPLPIKADKSNLERLYNSYTLVCYKTSDLEKYYYNPINFLAKNLH
ncbi:hypothetical protein BH10BAC1_BH10BAC1_14080 [soil metagenome]